ncbi:MAG: hypothetical protein HOF74_14250 [Gammaproteobacteria bacterium]|jgi:hypothetical protein|nr:hypothetical protein [Gammaproteobacteria bacterium]MBT3860987.1 hypothetical protein [Gammaproteobacteria bacterium]MBT3986256.1 hypothetical protein [Gammaproteobacteria bacterium]MBT4256075.1 hypothetical protein [Gammaproteobacteria bacterium]MBT4582670.1 hypothetical protein [Gammaproteobacteria bacterium]
MKKYILAVTFTLSAIFSTSGISFPSVFPTGTTIFQPEKTWSGYTILDAADKKGTVLIDMNGNVIRRWTELNGMGPFRILPGGYVMGGR